MRGAFPAAKASYARVSIVLCVLAGLCFSAGEGLRLTPIPVSAPAGVAATDERLNAAASRGASLHKYGPLDKPSQSQAQKRGKRQAPDCDCPPSQNTGQPNDDPLRDNGARVPAGFTSTPPLSEPADRAPPCHV